MASGQARRQPEERASRRPRSGVVEDGRHMRANRPRAVSRSRFVPPGLSPKNTRDGEQYRASNMSARTQAPKQTTCFIDDINKLA